MIPNHNSIQIMAVFLSRPFSTLCRYVCSALCHGRLKNVKKKDFKRHPFWKLFLGWHHLYCHCQHNKTPQTTRECPSVMHWKDTLSWVWVRSGVQEAIVVQVACAFKAMELKMIELIWSILPLRTSVKCIAGPAERCQNDPKCIQGTEVVSLRQRAMVFRCSHHVHQRFSPPKKSPPGYHDHTSIFTTSFP